MWVTMPDKQIGILIACAEVEIQQAEYASEDEDAEVIAPAQFGVRATVVLVKPDGTNQMRINDRDQAVPAVSLFPPAELRRSYISEIPGPRHPGDLRLRALGYLAEGESA